MLERALLDAPFSLRRLWAVVRDNRGFRRLYAANAVSQLGDWFNVVALFSLLVELTGAGQAVALALLTRFVPTFLAGPAAGVLADRISRRTILVASDVLRAALVLCLLLVRRPDQVWIAYAVVTAHSVVSAFFDTAQTATYPTLVPPADLPFAAFRFVGHDDRGLRRSIAGAFALLVCCYCGFALSPAIGWAACALALANAGGSILWTSGSTLLQRLVPDAFRGRVAAAELGGFMLALTASTLSVGLLLDHGVPPRALMAACGLVALLPLVFWIFVQPAFQVTDGRAPE